MSESTADQPRLIAVTGATGYVGGRLVAMLLEAGFAVRCIVREPRKLDDRPWRRHPAVSVVRSDVATDEDLATRLEGCEAAYYLIHSMEVSGSDYAERDRMLAERFAIAARTAGVGRIIYLGGLGEMGDGLSEHLSSRREVERLLASTDVPVTTFRAAMIIGSGSASFEILRYLVERLPIMITPSWVKTESQPIAIADVLHWLVRCLDVPETEGRTLEIGGADVLPYCELMRIMAEELELPRRIILPVPVLTPRLSSGWISLVTPVSYRIARPLAEGLRNRVVVTDDDVQRLMPHDVMDVRTAIRTALERVRSNDVSTRWSVAGPVPGDPEWAGGTVFTDERSIVVKAEAADVFRAVCRIGGGHGWYAGDILWRIRGWMDTVAGGPGLRRGRRDPERVEFGETLDFWRVIGIDRDRALTLLAEMKLPGTATLEFTTDPSIPPGETQLTMRARFRPKGIVGIMYWYAVLPLHNLVFGGMLRGIKRAAELSRASSTGPDDRSLPPPRPGYGRARLWLGMSAVGTLVLAAAFALGLGLPAAAATHFAPSFGSQALMLLGFVGVYAALQLPFDLFGGFLLPRRYRREHPTFGTFLLRLARGVTAQGVTLLVIAILLLAAGRLGGMAATIAAGIAISFVLLWCRGMLARIVAPLGSVAAPPSSAPAEDAMPTLCLTSEDEGFTGGIEGVLRPRRVWLPERWRQVLGPDGFRLARRRRALAVKTGGWWRGRVGALLFTWAGIALSTALVGADAMGTARGVIEVSLVFTLWSFLGLLLLPSLSRAGVVAVDERLRETEAHPQHVDETLRTLDGLQDAEPERPTLIETIFHPIPSVQNRLEGPRARGLRGSWDLARSAIFLSAAGLGLLGRAVHCNCGRPALWVFLPLD